MPPKRKSGGGEVVEFRSPAQFFSDHCEIAGFDNPGKSLLTTARELIENALDAAEAVRRLPSISITIEEMTAAEFDSLRGLAAVQSKAGASAAGAGAGAGAAAGTATTGGGAGAGKGKSRSDGGFYRVVCKDNGCGMRHDDIPNMMGRVLSGSKYGVRQTRGKFGLGAKMALIWSRKSTGLPIEIRSAHVTSGSAAAKSVSYCKLDIDIDKNLPIVHTHYKMKNESDWQGTEISLFIGGNWTTYKSRIMTYMTQLAIITPYAEFKLRYECKANPAKSFVVRFARRSTQMPPPTKEIKHHPASVNNLLLQQLVDAHPTLTLKRFLRTQLSSISSDAAVGIAHDMKVDTDTECGELTSNQVHRLVRCLRSAALPPPAADCLSPAGEYNLRLGILKEVAPGMVATHRQSVATFQGHPFIVEAGVSLGGKGAKEGITVYRFANRIPLLFEAGGDVVTRTAQKKIHWSTYKIDLKRDRIGVFVSIVSTKIPFKGTGKEYIGEDVEEMASAVKSALQACCQQLRVKLAKRAKAKDRQSRVKLLNKHVPLVTSSMVGVLKAIEKRGRDHTLAHRHATGKHRKLVADLFAGRVTEARLAQELTDTVKKAEVAAALEHVAETGRGKDAAVAMYIRPRGPRTDDVVAVAAPNFTFLLPSRAMVSSST